MQRWHKVALAIIFVVTLVALADLFLLTRHQVDEPKWPVAAEPAESEQARPEVDLPQPSYPSSGTESAATTEDAADVPTPEPSATDERSMSPTPSEASDSSVSPAQRGATPLPQPPPPRSPATGSGGATSGSQRTADRSNQVSPDRTTSPGGVAVGSHPRGTTAEGSDEFAESPRREPAATPLAEPDIDEDPGRPRSDDPPDEPPPTLATVHMIPSTTEPNVGDVVSIVIFIDGAAQVGHTPFHLHFNPQVLRFEFGAEGSFLGGDGQATAFFASPTSDGGSVVVGLSRLGRVPGIAGSGDLCMLQFSVVGAGNAALSFARAKVKDPNNQILPAVFQPAAVIAR
jgi:hypothetical protein